MLEISGLFLSILAQHLFVTNAEKNKYLTCLQSAKLALKHSFKYDSQKDIDDFDNKLSQIVENLGYVDSYRMLLDIALA